MKRRSQKRLLTIVTLLSMVQSLFIPLAGRAFAETAGSDTNQGEQVEITETVTNGFIHPGVGLTKTILETMRSEVKAQKEPWYSYYQAMTVSDAASKTVTSSNQSSADPNKPASDAFNSQGFNSRFIADGLKAYTQALMYYITGDETYRANAMHIIRIWSQMDPAKYVYFTDSHIHTGIPLNRMVTAAEILRYTSYRTPELAWTYEDTANFTNNLITPVIETFQHDNNHFMNQHNYPLLGAMAGYIFTDNRERYNEAVEWFTVNKTAKNQGFNGAIEQLFRLVDTNAATGEKLDEPVVQHVEMGRDQAHGGGDLTNSVILSRMMLAQGTKVDPVQGTVSTAEEAVGPYEFLNDRILAAANYFWKFMLGYDTPWIPVVYSSDENGNVKGIYQKLSDSYRGRMTTANFWDLYYYYTYVKGVDVVQKAPYYYEAFTKRIPSNYYHQGAFKINWDNVDGGGDFWLYLPKAVEAEGSAYLPKEQTSASLVEIEDRYTALEGSATTKREGGASYVEVQASPQGSQFVIQNLSYADRTTSRLIGLKFRTDGSATVQLSKEKTSVPYHTLTLPDTNGEWRYITYDMGISHVSYGQLDNDYNLLYMKVIGNGTIVDMDHFNVLANKQLTPPAFVLGNSDFNIASVAGASVTLDFSATDSGTGETLLYESSDLPEGASLNSNTGAFIWNQPAAGNYSFVVSVSDGTTVATKNVTLMIADSRESAMRAAGSGYNANLDYTGSSLQAYEAAAKETSDILQTAGDAEFFKQLLKLKIAADGLELLTPKLSDGSMDYPGIVSSSTFGTSISMLTDGNNNTYPVYTLAPYPDLYHILDFGPNYKVSATAFSLQSRMNFVDRMAGSSVFGSNDKATWTRLTPDETPFTDDLAKLEVSAAHRNEQYRFIKIQMLHPQPDVLSNRVGNMLELGEFRIFGERHEAVNKLQSVSIGSDQAEGQQITVGDTVKLTFQSTEPIHNVKAVIQGQVATLQTDDQLNWTAMVTTNRTMATGNIKFSIDYSTADWNVADPIYFTTDNSLLYLLDRKQFIDVAKLAKVTASDAPFGSVTKEQAGQSIFDGDISSFGDLQTAAGSYYTVDFGADSSVKLKQIMLMPRTSQPGRMNGLIVQGSNDKVAWTDLTQKATGSTAQTWTYIGGDQILNKGDYRYIRLYNASSWYGNIAEAKLYGEYETQDLESKMVSPDSYTQGSYYLYSKEVKRIKAAMSEPDADKMALFQEFTAANDLLVPRTELAGERIGVTSDMVAASTGIDQRSAAENGWRALDGDTSTFTDATGNPSWIQIDFGENQAYEVGSFKFYPRNGSDAIIKRANGAILQGSDDGVNYTNLYTISGVSAVKWYTVDLGRTAAYRYLRYYTANEFANVAELEFYKPIVDRTLLGILLDEAATLSAEDYSEDSFERVRTAAAAALPVGQNSQSTQSQIDAASAALLNALDGLRAARTLLEIKPVTVTTKVGVAPVLPNVVSAVYSDQGVQDVKVVWEPVGPDLYAASGSFTVFGSVEGTELKALAFVQVTEADAPADTEPPTPPSQLVATDITDHSLNLVWASSTDNLGIAGYDVYRDNEPIATVTSDTYNYSFGGLAADTAYTFKVVAYDAVGNHAASEDYTVKTLATGQQGNGSTDGNTGSTSGGSSGTTSTPAGAGSTSTTVDGGRIKATAEVNGGVAEVIVDMDSMVQAVSGLASGKTVTIQVSGADSVNALYVRLPSDAWLRAKGAGITSISFESGMTGLTLPIEAIKEPLSGGTIVLVVKKIDPAALKGDLAKRLQGMPVLDFSLLVNDQPVTTLPKGYLADLRLPYSAKPDQQLSVLVGVYIKEAEEAEVLPESRYDAGSGMLTLRTGHFSTYAVMSNPVVFTDLYKGFWATDSVVALAARRLISGVAEGQFAPRQEIARGEFLTMMMNAYGLTETGHSLSFTDTQPGQWYSNAVATAVSLGIATGYSDGSFGLKRAITRQEMAVIALRVLKAAKVEAPKTQAGDFKGFSDSAVIADYAREAVGTMGEAGWFVGRSEGEFAPGAHATRAEAAALIARMLGLA